MASYLLYPLIVVIVLWVAALAYYFLTAQKSQAGLAKNLMILSSGLLLAALIVIIPLHLRNLSLIGEFLIQPLYFYPILGSLLALIVSIVLFLLMKYNRKDVTAAKYILIGVLITTLIVTFVCLIVYYNREIAPYADYESVNSLWLYIGAFIIFGVLAVIGGLLGKKTNPKEATRSITFAAVSVALGLALSLISPIRMPQDGKVTIAGLLPLMLYSQMFGMRKGILVGAVFGLLMAIQDPWILHPAQFLLDYPLAFACIGVCSIFTQDGIKDKRGVLLFACGSVLAVLLRYAAHVLSGIFAFSMYAQPGYGAVAWGFLYNTFALADMAISLAVGVLMLLNNAFRKLVDGITYSAILPAPAQKTTPLSEKGE